MSHQTNATTPDHEVSTSPCARYLPRRERAALAPDKHSYDLSAEIALLRVLIGRQLIQPRSELLLDGGTTFAADDGKIRRYIGTLCCAIVVHRSLAKTEREEIDDALPRVLIKLMKDIEIENERSAPTPPWKPSLASSPSP